MADRFCRGQAPLNQRELVGRVVLAFEPRRHDRAALLSLLGLSVLVLFSGVDSFVNVRGGSKLGRALER